MKKIFYLILLFTFATALVIAQPTSGREKIKTMEVGYLTEKLKISVAEAEKFWPLYNAYKAEVRQIAKSNPEDSLQRHQKVLEIRNKFISDFKSVLDDKRGNQVFIVEREFRKMIREELYNRKKSEHRRL